MMQMTEICSYLDDECKYYMYIHMIYVSIPYIVHSISFQTSFVRAFKIVVDSWKQYVIAIHLMRWLDNFYEQLQQQLEYTLLKPDYHSWWISKMQSGREDTLEERYAIKFCFKLGKNATQTYGMLQAAFGTSCMNQASVFK